MRHIHHRKSGSFRRAKSATRTRLGQRLLDSARRGLHFFAATSLFAGLLSSVAVLAAPTAALAAGSQGGGVSATTLTAPANVTSMSYTITGGAGGGTQTGDTGGGACTTSSTSNCGQPATFSGVIPVTSGEVIKEWTGVDGSTTTQSNGANGAAPGGGGCLGGFPGGGASALQETSPTTLTLVMAGAGGGGDFGSSLRGDGSQ